LSEAIADRPSPFARLRESTGLYFVLAGASLRGQMQYRISFLLRSGIDAMIFVVDFLPIYFLMLRFGGLGDWRLAELALLYGMVSLSWSIVELTFEGFEAFGGHLVDGRLDHWLVRPRSIVLQVATHQVELRRVGRIVQALAVLTVAGFYLELSGAALAWVGLGIAGGVAFFAGILMLGAASQFWTLGQTSELQNMLTYGGTAVLSYPISIYSKWLRRIATFGIPLAFVNYFPALAALERTGAAGVPPFVPWLSPLVCAAVLGLGFALFARGLHRYESTGT